MESSTVSEAMPTTIPSIMKKLRRGFATHASQRLAELGREFS